MTSQLDKSRQSVDQDIARERGRTYPSLIALVQDVSGGEATIVAHARIKFAKQGISSNLKYMGIAIGVMILGTLAEPIASIVLSILPPRGIGALLIVAVVAYVRSVRSPQHGLVVLTNNAVVLVDRWSRSKEGIEIGSVYRLDQRDVEEARYAGWVPDGNALSLMVRGGDRVNLIQGRTWNRKYLLEERGGSLRDVHRLLLG